MDNGTFIDWKYWPKIELLPFWLCLITTHTILGQSCLTNTIFFNEYLEQNLIKVYNLEL